MDRDLQTRQLRYDRARLADVNLETIRNNLWEIQDACGDVEWVMQDEDTITNALDGNEEEAFEFKMMFADLSYECERLLDALGYDYYITEHFDDFFLGIMLRNQTPYKALGWDDIEEDYYALTRFETELAEETSAKRIKRLNKDNMLSVAGQCFGVAMAYFNVKYKYDYLKATIDVLRGENGAILQTIKEIEKAFDEMDLKRLERLTLNLPDRIWIE